MLVKLCPLCDCEMTGHYCKSCHSFIWKPEICDIHFDAEERGLGEEDCAYGEYHDTSHHDTDGWYDSYNQYSSDLSASETASYTSSSSESDKVRAAKERLKKKYPDGKRSVSTQSSSHKEVFGSSTSDAFSSKSVYKTTGRARSSSGRRKSGKGGIVLVVIFVIVINVLSVLIEEIESCGGLMNFLEYQLGMDLAKPYDEWDREIYGEWEDDPEKDPYDGFDEFETSVSGDLEADPDTLEEADPEDYPDGCNTKYHFDADRETACYVVDMWLEENGFDYTLDMLDENFYKPEDDRVFLFTRDVYNIENGGYISIETDSGNQKLHEIFVDGIEKDAFSALITDLLTELARKNEAKTLVHNIMGALEAGEPIDIRTEANLCFYGSVNEDGTLWGSIYGIR